MASTGSRPNLRNKAGEEFGSKRMGGGMETSKGGFPPNSTQTARQASDIAPSVPRTNSQARIQSRIPQNSYGRYQPTLSRSRPPLTHETRQWGSSVPSQPPTIAPSTADSSRGQDDAARQRRNVLRRKQPSVRQDIKDQSEHSILNPGRNGSSSSVSGPQASLDARSRPDRGITEKPMEIKVAQKVELPKGKAHATAIYPELDRYRNINVPRDFSNSASSLRLATHDLPPPTPFLSSTSTVSGTPSTRYSQSPASAPYSRDTTPTSISSASPSIVAPLRHAAARLRQASPAHAGTPLTRRRAETIPHDSDTTRSNAPVLAAVGEVLTSSSISTVRDADREKKMGISQQSLDQPSQVSSQGFHRGRVEDPSPTRPSRVPAQSAVDLRSPDRHRRMPSEDNEYLVTSPLSRGTPPSRPSRDGTSDLYSQYGGPIPVIHSNLSSTSVSDRRQSGQFSPTTTSAVSLQDRFSPTRAPVRREPTPTPYLMSSGHPQHSRTGSDKATRSRNAGVSALKTGFGLFSRRGKTETGEQKAEKKEKLPRKGPAAGTGHEGYGRVGAVRRPSANAMHTAPGPLFSSSETLVSNKSTTDPFLLDRMKPVIIAGGQVVENQNASGELDCTEQHQANPSHHPGHSRNGSSVSLALRDRSRHNLWPSALPHSTNQSRRPSESSNSEAVTMKPTIAFRRSVQRLRSSPDQQPVQLPKPISTQGVVASPPFGSIDTTVTDDSFIEAQPAPLQAKDENTTAPKKLTKRAKSPRRWNLFSRSHNQPAKPPKQVATAAVAAAVKPVQTKPVAFYTMMDSSPEDGASPDVNQVLRDAEALTPPESTVREGERPSQDQRHMNSSVVLQEIVKPEQTQTPSAQAWGQPFGPEAIETQPISQPATQPASRRKPSRLPQVGRIPKVVRTQEPVSPKSFSRPFQRTSAQLAPQQQSFEDPDSIAKGPSPRHPPPEVTMEKSMPMAYSGNHRTSAQGGFDGTEFFAFSPRHNSECTTISTSSSSCITAIIPAPNAPLAEDEIWDEYNDLLGDVVPLSISSRDVPSHMGRYESNQAEDDTKPLTSPTIKHPQAPGFAASCDTETGASSSHFGGDMAARSNVSPHVSTDPSARTFSISDFVSGYDERNTTTMEVAKVRTSSQRSSSSSRKSAAIRHSNSSSASEETPRSQVNIRVGSMTVSKWLTFGHVLFSPIRDELIPVVGSLKRQSILIIDGLGNDDWSFYAAETYPAANFFNLSPRAPLSQEQRSSSSFPPSPPNHHQIQYKSHLNKFPFGPDSFSSVVFRFPTAAPESHYRNIVSEARRVLKPGGYIELSILDPDMNNMGNRARRTVRQLKERINTRNPDYNLSSTSDLMLRLLGRKGFADVKTCRLGLPAVSAGTSPTAAGTTAKGKKKRDERSMAEMMSDETETGDESITKMVAKVGRWWYSRLYEAGAGGVRGGSSSVWKDRALLAECEEWRTSLKLMVCYARVPETRPRVSSV